jgi:hypothetical protein
VSVSACECLGAAQHAVSYNPLNALAQLSRVLAKRLQPTQAHAMHTSCAGRMQQLNLLSVRGVLCPNLDPAVLSACPCRNAGAGEVPHDAGSPAAIERSASTASVVGADDGPG